MTSTPRLTVQTEPLPKRIVFCASTRAATVRGGYCRREQSSSSTPSVRTAGALENPVPWSTKSGVGIISGWVCEAEELTARFDSGPQKVVPYGSERTDTAGVCGDTDNGFGLLWNYSELGDGPHTVTLYVDGEVATSVNFNVQTLGTNFLRGVAGSGTITLSNGLEVMVRWEESSQGFTIIDYE